MIHILSCQNRIKFFSFFSFQKQKLNLKHSEYNNLRINKSDNEEKIAILLPLAVLSDLHHIHLIFYLFKYEISNK